MGAVEVAANEVDGVFMQQETRLFFYTRAVAATKRHPVQLKQTAYLAQMHEGGFVVVVVFVPFGVRQYGRIATGLDAEEHIAQAHGRGRPARFDKQVTLAAKRQHLAFVEGFDKEIVEQVLGGYVDGDGQFFLGNQRPHRVEAFQNGWDIVGIIVAADVGGSNHFTDAPLRKLLQTGQRFVQAGHAIIEVGEQVRVHIDLPETNIGFGCGGLMGGEKTLPKAFREHVIQRYKLMA